MSVRDRASQPSDQHRRDITDYVCERRRLALLRHVLRIVAKYSDESPHFDAAARVDGFLARPVAALKNSTPTGVLQKRGYSRVQDIIDMMLSSAFAKSAFT